MYRWERKELHARNSYGTTVVNGFEKEQKSLLRIFLSPLSQLWNGYRTDEKYEHNNNNNNSSSNSRTKKHSCIKTFFQLYLVLSSSFELSTDASLFIFIQISSSFEIYFIHLKEPIHFFSIFLFGFTHELQRPLTVKRSRWIIKFCYQWMRRIAGLLVCPMEGSNKTRYHTGFKQMKTNSYWDNDFFTSWITHSMCVIGLVFYS